jgi:uncharacterized membrane protein YcaP (DUF421 family)
VELHVIVIRAAFSYIALLALLRASQKTALAEATPFDFVLALVMGDMIDDVLWGDVGAAKFMVAVGALTLSHTLIAMAGYHSRTVHDLVASHPTVLLQGGEPVGEGLRAELVSERDLDEFLRLQGVSREQWGDLEIVRLEPGGEASVIKRPRAREAQKSDVGER